MKIPVSWLREYVEVDATTREICERLAISTFELERISYRGVPDVDGNLGLYRVGLVLEAGKHPNADRLQLCTVDVGDGEARQIVCGAWNFGAGAYVAVALPGAVMPGGQKLEQAKLRGVVSNGMILSERELEIGPDHSGIIVLGKPIDPGTPLADVLPLGEEVIEAETSFNRPDLLSIYGIAREVAAVFNAELKPMPGREPDRPVDPEPVEVRVDDPAGCPRYIGRLFHDARIGPSPEWMKARLSAAGQRPISNAVDITNYVMLALGSPLHAFDRRKLAQGRIIVRRAEPGEEVRTLDGELRGLDPSDLVIADAERAVALAGIMGGEETELSDDTSDILLEAANFEPVGIMRTSERLALRTEGSNRWEKGVDPYIAEPGRDLRNRAAGRADGGALCRRDRRAGRPPGAAGHAAAAGADRRGRRARDPARRAAPDPGAAGLRGRGACRGRHGPDLARPGRHAGDRRGRGGHPGPRARAGAVHAAAAARDVRAADARNSACAA